jgi:hypothetical protein
MYTTKEERGFAAVSLEGASDVLRDAATALRVAGFQVEAIGKNTILLRDVRESAVSELEGVTKEFKLRPLAAYGRKTFVTREKVAVQKPLVLALEPGKWYFSEANKHSFPFVRVRDVRLEKTGNNGDSDQIFKLELYSPDHAMPRPMELCAKDVVAMELRAATEDDFIQSDMITPAAEDLVMVVQPSHGVPDPNLDPAVMQPVETLQPFPMKNQHWQ